MCFNMNKLHDVIITYCKTYSICLIIRIVTFRNVVITVRNRKNTWQN